MSSHSCLWYIRDLNFFPQLSDASMVDLAENSRMITASRGDRLSVETTNAGHAYLVKAGHLRLLRRGGDGREVGLDILGPGDVLGLTPIVTEDGDADFAIAVDEVLLCRLPAWKLRETLEVNPGLALHFSKFIGLRRRRLESRLISIAFCPVKVRLARVILELSETFGDRSGEGVRLRLRLTYQEFGDLIGSNREAANRAASVLIDAGAIRYSGKDLIIVSFEILRREAELDFFWPNVSADTALDD